MTRFDEPLNESIKCLIEYAEKVKSEEYIDVIYIEPEVKDDYEI
jgi:hypothetical protein